MTDRNALADLAREVIADCPRAAADFRAGKTAALQALLGQMMRRTQGRQIPPSRAKLCLACFYRENNCRRIK